MTVVCLDRRGKGSLYSLICLILTNKKELSICFILSLAYLPLPLEVFRVFGRTVEAHKSTVPGEVLGVDSWGKKPSKGGCHRQ